MPTNEKKVLVHMPPQEFARDTDGKLVRMKVWEKTHPLTPAQIESNRRGFMRDFGLTELDFA